MSGIVNIVVGIFWNIMFRLWCRIFVEVMVFLLYEDVMFWSMDAIVIHYIKLQRGVFFQ
jgi:hypothetical protein